jgi:hypothetical protein
MTDIPAAEDEWQRAAERLERASDPTPSPSYDARIQEALDVVRSGDLQEGRGRLVELAAQGSAPAASVLSWLDRYGSAGPVQSDALRRSLAQIRHGDAQGGYDELVRLAEDGYGPASHFLGWLYRYRAEESLRKAADRFRLAAAAGHAPSQLHLERTLEALRIVGSPPPQATNG